MAEIYSFDNFTLYASEDDIKNFTLKNRIDMIDNEGYKYFFNRSNVSNIRKRHRIPARFFDLNPYTEENIRLYLEKETNGEIYILDFCNAQSAHDEILLYDSNIDLSYKKSWNEIKNNRYVYKTKYPDYVHPEYRKGFISSRRLSKEFVAEKLKERGLIMVGEYRKNNAPIEFICEKHKDKGIQKMSWVTIRNSPCPCKYCKKDNWQPKKSDEEFKEEVKNLKNSNIEIIGEYTGTHNKIECKCNKCGRIIFLRADHIRRGIGCGYCTKSIGEDRVETFLKNHSINYKREYRFKDCVRVQKPMPFDFYIPDMNTAIEFDGVQHFQVIGKFGGQKDFDELKLNDEFKTEYCKRNNINLIRISYKEINQVNDILSQRLNLEQKEETNYEI